MTTIRQPHRFLVVSWMCAVSPLLVLVAFITLGIHVRLGLGHWPTPMVEEYRTIASDTHHAILAIIAQFALYAAGPLWLVCLCFRPLRPDFRVGVSQLAMCATGWLMIVAIVAFDPTQFTAWVLD